MWVERANEWVNIESNVSVSWNAGAARLTFDLGEGLVFEVEGDEAAALWARVVETVTPLSDPFVGAPPVSGQFG